MGVGHRVGERGLRTSGYSPLGQGPPSDLADPGQRRGLLNLSLCPGGPPPCPCPSQARITPCPRITRTRARTHTHIHTQLPLINIMHLHSHLDTQAPTPGDTCTRQPAHSRGQLAVPEDTTHRLPFRPGYTTLSWQSLGRRGVRPHSPRSPPRPPPRESRQ